MTLGIFLPLGESLTGMATHGQDVRFVNYYLKHYCQRFEKVLVFSYKNEKYNALPENCELICPKRQYHRYLYGLLLPFIQKSSISKCSVFRCFHPSGAIPAIVAKLFFGKKFIFNYNYDYTKWAVIENKAFLIPWLKFTQWLAFKSCSHVFVADEKMQIYGKKFVTPSKITIVRNAVDTTAFKPRSRKIKSNKKIILSVGRLESQKNYLQLVNAVSNLKTKKVKLRIVGKGSLKEELLKKASQLEVDLEIIDVIPNNQLPETYNSANIYVQPSLIEAPVKTLLEAMSCGLPCVATNVPGIKEVIEDNENGMLANLDAIDLTNKLDRLLRDKSLATKLSLNARKTITSKYDLFKFLELETKILTVL